jgi:hypothetical protein
MVVVIVEVAKNSNNLMKVMALKRAAASARMDKVMSRGHLSSVATTSGDVVAQRGHHNIN